MTERQEGVPIQERLDNAIEALALLCEPVEPPKGELEHIHYFCGNTEIPADLQDREAQRAALYKATVTIDNHDTEHQGHPAARRRLSSCHAWRHCS